MGHSMPRRMKAAACAVLFGGLLVALLSVLPATAGALESRFRIDDGARYTRSLWVKLGDDGYTPFFEPGVVAWQGGSIMAGRGATAGYKFSEQTLALVPRACQSYLSVEGNARIAELLERAPAAVDQRFRRNADLNVSLVLAGGGDFYHGADPTTVYAGLKEYCALRRAAGFKVIVLTVLPRKLWPAFEAARTAYNQLLRQTWPEFADGLADIAADPRIGDQFDNLDLRYYRADATHPNNAGCAVMASVTAPVLSTLSWQSRSCEMRVRDAGSAWSSWRPYADATSWELPAGDGVKTVVVEYRQAGGTPVAVSDSIELDTAPPTTVAPRRVVVRRGATATFAYSVIDPAPCGPLAGEVKIVVTSPAHRVVATLKRVGQPVNAALSASFTVPRTWRRGAYSFEVLANDNAGNPQAVTGANTLVVK